MNSFHDEVKVQKLAKWLSDELREINISHRLSTKKNVIWESFSDDKKKS